MLSEQDKKRVRSEIETRISQTEMTVQSLKEQTKPVAPDPAIGRITRMDAIQQKSVNEANLRTAEETLGSLRKAVKLIDDPDFGSCVLCRNPIPIERILAIPETTRCVSCAGQ